MTMQSHINKISPAMRPVGEIIHKELKGFDPFCYTNSKDTYAALQKTVTNLDDKDKENINAIREDLSCSKLHKGFGDSSILELLFITALWLKETHIEPEQLHDMVETYRFTNKKSDCIDLGEYEIGQPIG